MAVCSKCANRELGSDWKCPACGADFGAWAREVVAPELPVDAPFAAEPAYGPAVDGRRPKSVKRLATAVTLLFGLQVVLDVACLFTFVHRYQLMNKIENDPGTVSLADVQASDRDVRTWFIANVVAVAVIAIFFIWWLYTARRNTLAYGRDEQRFGPGWAIGGWFVPFANFWIPYQVTMDVYRNSTGAGEMRSLPGYLPGWWAMFIGSDFLLRFQLDRSTNSTVEGVKHIATWAMIGLVLGMVCAALAVLVVQKITSLQEARNAEHSQMVAGYT